jgi:hypothetical protein
MPIGRTWEARVTTQVRKLKITDPFLSAPVTVDIPWDQFPAADQRELGALDADHDGTLTYASVPGGAAAGGAAEVQHDNDTANRLNRILWGLAWVSPSNNRLVDRATLDDRMRRVQTLQNDVYDKVVLPLLGDRTDPAKWRQAQRILSEVGDYAHLYRLAQIARATYSANKNVEILRVAEGMLLAAKKYASPVRDGRLNYFKAIEGELLQINPILDGIDRNAFQANTKSPYLMASLGSPITADLSTLQKDGGMVRFGVAVPQSFVSANSKDLNKAIQDYFNQNLSASVRASTFKDAYSKQEFPLTAVRVERDTPGSADDPIDAQSSFHLDQARLNRTVFTGQGMAYFRVGFRLEKPSEALNSQNIGKFDIILKEGAASRTIPGGFILQNMEGQASRDVFASDVHVSERDYEIVRIMADSLRSKAFHDQQDGNQPDQIPILRSQAEEVERFYESINLQVEAAVDLWNEAYRTGQIDRVFLAGDLADFVNLAITLDRQDYRGTNIRRLREILGRIEAPLYVVSGNHDHHGQPFPLSLHKRNFINNVQLQDLYQTHYDRPRFGSDESLRLYGAGFDALLPLTGKDSTAHILSEFYAKDPFENRNDDFLNHHMREIGIYETYGTGLGNGFRVFAWPTETEHFNLLLYLEEEAHDPLLPNALKGFQEYIVRQHVNGKGPRPETFIAFLREMEAAQKSGQRLILMGHYPAFFAGEGPDQTPDSVDTLRGDVAWALRMSSWYYRRPDGEAVLPLSVAGHVHHYAESDFTFQFKDAAQEEKFRKELGTILAKKNASSIFEDLHHLRHAWDLDNRIEIRRVQDSGSDGFPGPILKDLNSDSHAYCKKRGTAFLTLPAAGIPTEEDSGYVVITTQPDGRINIAPKFIRVGPRANVISMDGSQLESYRKGRWDEVQAWDSSRNIAAFQAHTQPTAVTTTGPGTPGHLPHWDFFPVVYQYPRKKIALTFDPGWQWDARSGNTGWSLGGQLLFPLTHDVNTTLGGPNWFGIGAEYTWLSHDLRGRLGLDWGIPTTYFTVNRILSGNPAYGIEVDLHSIFPHAALTVWGESDKDKNWAAGLGLRLTLPILTYRMSEHYHF